MTTDTPTPWFKSSYSDNGGACVETAAHLVATHGIVPVRDSKFPDGPALSLTTPAFSTFIAGIKSGQFQVR
ncbi:DUF397 domain-containing protein [Streptomyces sp. NBC_00237]|uniref:DUF397 domain-containing protein n=1 Tax=Streptomyces sp. NBC_00237 TaxID=2975687 RepID=UPI0022511621|nr:DUF397 domain-containing protein [Streptomyces sp. NBC_00237]MCX5201876.1 DUF397 domain-containing protein [Streptomyces sp. NBC_00237]